MHRVLTAGVCLAIAIGTCGKLIGGDDVEPSFHLSIDAAEEVLGIPGEPIDVIMDVILSTEDIPEGVPGVQGWSVSIVPEGWIVSDATTVGTTAGDVNDEPPGIRNTGFVSVNVTDGAARPGSDCEGRIGIVSAVVLSFTMPITLPIDESSSILRLTLSGNTPEDGEDCVPCSVAFVDGCQGPGQPVDNKVTLAGNTRFPTSEDWTTLVCPDPDCGLPGKASLTFSAAAVVGSGDVDNHVSEEVDRAVVSACKPIPCAREVKIGDPGEMTVFANIASVETISGIQGWSISGSIFGDIVLLGVTDAGTASADAPDGVRNTGFFVAEPINPELPHPDTGKPQGPGFVSAAVLSFTMPITLPTTSTTSILAVTLGTDGPMPELEEGESVDGSVEWVENNTGSGQPVKNAATIRGATNPYCCKQGAIIQFLPLAELEFKRCDPNIDGETNLADGIYIVNELFRSGPATTCRDSGDCNDDGAYDLSDATYALANRFTGGAPPPPPFEECGLESEVSDAGEDELDCGDYPPCDRT